MSATPTHTPPPSSSGAKDEAQSAPWLYLVVIAIFCMYWMYSCSNKDDETATVTQSAPAQSAPAVQLEPNAGRMLTIDRKTPFCDQMEYSASFETEGDSIRILYDSGGDSRNIRYLGKGDNLEGTFLQRTPGKPICFESLDSSKTVRVRIYRIVNIYLKQP